MAEAQLQRIESELNIALPLEYRATMLNYPFVPGTDYPLTDDDNLIIQANRYNRDHGFFGLAWSRHYFEFGGDGSGNAYFLDLSLPASPVFFADHEAQLYVEESPSFKEWLEAQKQVYIEIQAEIAEEEADLAAYQQNSTTKKWWRFWK